jgi:hypothetical protein
MQIKILPDNIRLIRVNDFSMFAQPQCFIAGFSQLPV